MTVPLGGAAAGFALTVERDSGGFRLSSPAAPGWVAVARNPVELARAVEQGVREAEVAAYAARRGERYDLALHDQAAYEVSQTGRLLPADEDERASLLTTLACAQPPSPPAAVAHDPLAWTPLPDGRYLSPGGRRYSADAQVVKRVRARRAEMGVDTVG